MGAAALAKKRGRQALEPVYARAGGTLVNVVVSRQSSVRPFVRSCGGAVIGGCALGPTFISAPRCWWPKRSRGPVTARFRGARVIWLANGQPI